MLTRNGEAGAPSSSPEMVSQGVSPSTRAAVPRPPAQQPLPDEAEQARKQTLVATEAKEQRSMLRGLVLLALLALVVALLRHGAARTFYSGWWRQW